MIDPLGSSTRWGIQPFKVILLHGPEPSLERGELSEEELRQLVRGVRATTGIETLVWLVDVAGLSRDEAVELMTWSAQALLQHAMTAPPPTPKRKRASKGRPRGVGRRGERGNG